MIGLDTRRSKITVNLFDPSSIVRLQIRYSKRKRRGFTGAILEVSDEWISMDNFMGCHGLEVHNRTNVLSAICCIIEQSCNRTSGVI